MLDRPQGRPHQAALRGLVGLVALVLALVAGCAGTTTPTTTTDVQPPAATAEAAAPVSTSTSVLAASQPTRLRIPAIGVDASRLIDLGLKPNGEMEVPADGPTVGWYTKSPTPGERGPAVLAGHVDWNGPAVFYDLHRLKSGDEIAVVRADGTSPVFQVQRVEQYPKDQFPTEKVYGNVAGAELRLITCGGEFDHSADHYRDNLVVYAGLVRSD